MTKEQVQSPAAAKPQQLQNLIQEEQFENQQTDLQPGFSFDLPRAGLFRKILLFQRAAGNRAVQRLLNTNVIQREGDTTPIPALPDVEARRLFALTVLKKAYGGMIKQEPNVTEAKGIEAMQALYDQSMIRQKKTFKEGNNEREWQKGDAAKRGDMNKDFPGFYDSGKNIVLDTGKKPDEQTATLAHEMLHANSNGEILGSLGKDVDEGITETLTKKAFTKAGYSYPGGFFESNMKWIGRLSGIFGENTLMFAYFTGIGPLRGMMNATMDDEDAFDDFAGQVRAQNWPWTNLFFDKWEKIVRGSEVEKKVAAVVRWLEQFWIDDEDISDVENIYRGSTPEEQARLRQEILPRIGNISDHGHRARLRILIGG